MFSIKYSKKEFIPKENQEYYLTEYISDCYDKWEKIKNLEGTFEYSNGGHSEPYNEEIFNEYGDGFASVWLMKRHDTAKQMSFNKFAKQFKEEHGNVDVIVKYEEGRVILTFVG